MKVNMIKELLYKDIAIQLKPVIRAKLYNYNIQLDIHTIIHDMLFNSIETNCKTYNKYNIEKDNIISLMDYCYIIQCKTINEFVNTDLYNELKKEICLRDMVKILGNEWLDFNKAYEILNKNKEDKKNV
jgi:hypothetical protein